MSAKLMTVIVTDMEPRGKGVEGDPFRRITQYWSQDGELLVEKDPCPPDELYAIPEKEETCKWNVKGKNGIKNPHDKNIWTFYPHAEKFTFCPTCGKRIEVVE